MGACTLIARDGSGAGTVDDIERCQGSTIERSVHPLEPGWRLAVQQHLYRKVTWGVGIRGL